MHIKQYITLLMATAALCGCSREKAEYEKAIEHAKALPPIKDVTGTDMLLPGEEEVVRECEEVMRQLQSDGATGAFAVVRRLSPLSEEELSKLEAITRDQVKAVEPRYGKIVGYERVSVEKKAESVLCCVYIAKCERHLLRWRFYFYRPADKWFLNSFLWDDKIQEL